MIGTMEGSLSMGSLSFADPGLERGLAHMYVSPRNTIQIKPYLVWPRGQLCQQHDIWLGKKRMLAPLAAPRNAYVESHKFDAQALQ